MLRKIAYKALELSVWLVNSALTHSISIFLQIQNNELKCAAGFMDIQKLNNQMPVFRGQIDWKLQFRQAEFQI